MTRCFNLLFFLPGLLAGLAFAHAEGVDPNAGHIGSSLSRNKKSDFFIVDYVAVKSPADQAGIKKGDCVTAIDGISSQKMSTEEALHFFNGSIGGIVTLTVQRDGAPGQQIAITRRSLLDAYSPAANMNDPQAEFYLGHFYEYSPYPIRDYTKATEWYRKSADQGYAPSQVNLAYLCRYGLGTPVDPKAASALYLKAAEQDDSVAERELALSYFNGEGIARSDKDAFAWFYAAARHDDPVAEQFLGFLYQKGRGVVRDDKAAFAWYYRSAERQNPYGEWNLSFMYERGYGVKPNLEEAYKWAQKAEVALPKNETLGAHVALLSLITFLETRDSSSLDLSLLKSVYHRGIAILFVLAAGLYAGLGATLGIFGFRRTDAPPRLPLAIGWIIFYMESQFVAIFAILLLGKTLTAGLLVLAMALYGALPVIIFSLGSNWKRIWKASSWSWSSLVLCGLGCGAAFFIMDLAYDRIYTLTTGSRLAAQSTHALLIKAKDSSPWIALTTLALVLPVAEEILFRGYLFEALKKRFSGITVVIVTALAFALVHLQWSHFALLFGMGLVLGWAKLKTGSLRLPVLLHAINNGLVLVVAS